MAKKPKIEVDESLVKQVIAGQLPLTTKVTREIEDPAQQEPQAEPDVAAGSPEKKHKIVLLRHRSPGGDGQWSFRISSRPI